MQVFQIAHFDAVGDMSFPYNIKVLNVSQSSHFNAVGKLDLLISIFSSSLDLQLEFRLKCQ